MSAAVSGVGTSGRLRVSPYTIFVNYVNRVIISSANSA